MRSSATTQGIPHYQMSLSLRKMTSIVFVYVLSDLAVVTFETGEVQTGPHIGSRNFINDTVHYKHSVNICLKSYIPFSSTVDNASFSEHNEPICNRITVSTKDGQV